MKPTLVVLAAGMGSRYGGVKQMDGFGPGEQWLLEYSVYDAIQAGFGKVVFILRAAILEDFKNYFEERLPVSIEREYVLQELTNLPGEFTPPSERVKPWGTGQAVLVTKDVVNEPFAVINADDYYGPEAYVQLNTFLNSIENSSFQFGMVGYRLKNTLSEHGSVSRGLCNMDNNHMLIKVEEHTKVERMADGSITNVGEGSQKTLKEESVVSMNCWAFSHALFDKLEEQFKGFLESKGEELKSEFYIPFAVQDLMNEGVAKVKVLTSDDEWFGVTYADDRIKVEAELAKKHEIGVYPSNLWA